LMILTVKTLFVPVWLRTRERWRFITAAATVAARHFPQIRLEKLGRGFRYPLSDLGRG
jgi:hypothetical protein